MDDADQQRFAALEARVAELENGKVGRMYSMAQTRRCPACGGVRLLYFRHIKDVAHQQIVDLSLQKQPSFWAGFKGTAGTLEAFACRNCRLVEWHAKTLDDVVIDGAEVVELDGSSQPTPAAPPYR